MRSSCVRQHLQGAEVQNHFRDPKIKIRKNQPRLSFVIFFASAAVLCYNTAPPTGHDPASPG
jgi:hypothetical protein